MEFTYDITMFKEIFESEFTWLNGFMRNVRRFGDKTAMFDPLRDASWSYEQLNRDVNRLANALKKDGVGRGDVVMYQLLNSPEFAFCYIAPQKLCGINSPGNYNLAPGETAKILEHNRPKVYIYDSEIRDMALKALELSSYRPVRVVMVDYAGKVGTAPEGHVLFSDYVKDMPDTEPEMGCTPNIYDECTRFYTSGTTSLPKGVPVNNINEVLSAHDVMMHFPLNSTDKTMNMTPWFHRGGLHSGGLTPTFYAGGEVVVLRSFNPRTCLKYAAQYGITFLIGAPSVLVMLAKQQENRPVDLSHLKGIVTMGSPLEKAACMRYQKVLTPNIFNGYGTTETFWNTFLRPYDLPEMSGTAGRACTDDEVLVVKAYDECKAEPDELVPQDNETVGEIIIKSPAKSACAYYNNAEVTKQKYYKGWLYTGDLGIWDKNQFVSIVGRKDDMIICSGENIYPTQIEEVLNEHPKVADCVVTSAPDATRGEIVVAYVIPEDKSLTIQELVDFCAASPNLSAYKRPRMYRLVDSLPQTATGKKMHYKAKEIAKADMEAGLFRRK